MTTWIKRAKPEGVVEMVPEAGGRAWVLGEGCRECVACTEFLRPRYEPSAWRFVSLRCWVRECDFRALPSDLAAEEMASVAAENGICVDSMLNLYRPAGPTDLSRLTRKVAA